MPTIQKAISSSPERSRGVEKVILTGIKDFLPFPLKWLYVLKAKKEKKFIGAPKKSFVVYDSMKSEFHHSLYRKKGEIAQLQYTGGTTGDMAKMDEEGYFYIVDRKKGMIKTSGENVYPREIEEILFKDSRVLDAAVVGIPDPTGLGEKIKAFVILKPDIEPSEQNCPKQLLGKS